MAASLTGKVFDIQRFSLHDGDGIRTTVFLKGCPMRCVWCQNPEGISSDTHLVINETRCIRCGLCTNAIPSIQMKADGYPDVREVPAEQFDRAVTLCPAGALVKDCRVLSVSQVMDEVERDKVFFRRGGGVTFSGGEPFAQPAFFLALLKEAKARGLHTAAESCLYTTSAYVQQALPFIDLLFADFKLFDDIAHKKQTGVSNRQIVENLSFYLREKPAGQIIVRTPLIPGLTASTENIRKISAWLAGIHPNVPYELLNYNPLAAAKYARMDHPYCFRNNPPPFTRSEMQAFAQIAKDTGIQTVIIGD